MTLRTRTSTTPTRLRRRSERGRRKIGLLNGHKSRLSGDGGREGRGRRRRRRLTHSILSSSLARSLLGAQRDANAGEEGRTGRQQARSDPPPPPATPFITSDSAAAEKSHNSPSHFEKDAPGPPVHGERSCVILRGAKQWNSPGATKQATFGRVRSATRARGPSPPPPQRNGIISLSSSSVSRVYSVFARPSLPLSSRHPPTRTLHIPPRPTACISSSLSCLSATAIPNTRCWRKMRHETSETPIGLPPVAVALVATSAANTEYKPPTLSSSSTPSPSATSASRTRVRRCGPEIAELGKTEGTEGRERVGRARVAQAVACKKHDEFARPPPEEEEPEEGRREGEREG